MIKLWKSVIYKIVHHRNPGVLRICEMCEKKKKKNSLSNSFFLLPKLREESSIEIPIFVNEASFDPPFLIYAFTSFLVHASRSKNNSAEYCRPWWSYSTTSIQKSRESSQIINLLRI